MTDGAGEGELSLLVSNDQPHEALLAVDMEALEYLWVSVELSLCPDKWCHLAAHPVSQLLQPFLSV